MVKLPHSIVEDAADVQADNTNLMRRSQETRLSQKAGELPLPGSSTIS